MARIIMDVTQLAHKTGKITGIPRVMDELAKRLYQTARSEVMFVSWVASRKEFYQIDFEQTILRRNGIVYTQPGAAKAAATPASLSGQDSIMKKFLKKGYAAANRVSPQLAGKIKSQLAQAKFEGYDPITFHKGDILFIPWGEWWDANFTARLARVPQEGAKLVQIIHDIGPTIWPQFFEQLAINPTTYNAQILPLCSLVLTVSHNTKKELVQWLRRNDLTVPRVEVFRLGDDLQVAQPIRPTEPQFKQAALKGNDFLLCVGTLEAKKNHQLFYYVYKLAKSRGIQLPKLVIVGRRGYQAEHVIKMMTLDPEVQDKFIFLFDASDEELSWLYDHCMFTILPSFHEGWGIPIAESLARGVPVLCSNTSSMVEIAEGIVGHFSPSSPDECLAAMQAWLTPKGLEAARKKTKTYKQFHWDESFGQVRGYLGSLNN